MVFTVFEFFEDIKTSKKAKPVTFMHKSVVWVGGGGRFVLPYSAVHIYFDSCMRLTGMRLSLF